MHTTCVDCASGKYLSDDATDHSSHDSESDCLECPIGEFSLPGAGSCTGCGLGKYSEESGVCLDCPEGKFSSTGGGDLSSCNPCLPGTYSTPGAGSCLNCERGKYNEQQSQGSCTNCGPGRYSTMDAAKVESACRNCQPGRYSAEEVRAIDCDVCARGTSAPYPGASSCSSCPANRFII